MIQLLNYRIFKLFFFGNYFYALCAVALSIEGSLQQGYALNSWIYYLLAFSSTQVYYTEAYLESELSVPVANVRSIWYEANKKKMQYTQYFFSAVIAFCLIVVLLKYYSNILHFSLTDWISFACFPIVALFYYGVEIKFFGQYSLRTIGWLKPIVIGFTWAGLVTVYPILYDCLEKGTHYSPGFVGTFLFIKNFMYITILCILFDIKDYAMDYNDHIKTIVVKLGLRKTLFYLIIPLCFIGLASFYVYALFQHFSTAKIAINTIPFLLIISVAYSLSSRRSIFYYLIIIDGLMLVKAICGITASTFF